MPGTAPSFEIALQVAAQSGGVDRLVRAGDTLRSGDLLAIEVLVDAPVFVYAVQVSAAGTPLLLFPRAGDQQVLPGEPMRLPGPDDWFRLDHQPGEEVIHVVAARHPMGEGSLAARMGLSLRGVFRDDEPPPLADLPKRPVKAAAEALRASADDSDVAVLRFALHHSA